MAKIRSGRGEDKTPYHTREQSVRALEQGWIIDSPDKREQGTNCQHPCDLVERADVSAPVCDECCLKLT